MTNQEVIAYNFHEYQFGVPCLKDLGEIQHDCMGLLPSEQFKVMQTSFKGKHARLKAEMINLIFKPHLIQSRHA